MKFNVRKMKWPLIADRSRQHENENEMMLDGGEGDKGLLKFDAFGELIIIICKFKLLASNVRHGDVIPDESCHHIVESISINNIDYLSSVGRGISMYNTTGQCRIKNKFYE